MKFTSKYRRLFRRLALILGMGLGVILILLLSLRSETVQNYISDKVLASLSERYDASFSIGSVNLEFFDELTLKEVLFLDQQKDTLLSADEVNVDIGFFSLLNKKLNVNELYVVNLSSKFYSVDSLVYNFSFLVSNDQKSKSKSSNQSWDFGINSIILDIDEVYFIDQNITYKANDLALSIDLDKIQLEEAIELESINLKGGKSLLRLMKADDSKEDKDNQSDFLDLGLSVIAKEIEIQDHDLTFIKDTLNLGFDIPKMKLSEINISDSLWTVSSNNSSLSFDDYPVLKEIDFSFLIDKNSLEINNLDIKASKEIFSAKNFLYRYRDNSRVQSENLIMKLSPSTLKRLNEQLRLPFKPIRDTHLDIKVDQLDLSNNSYSVSNLLIKYPGTLGFEGDLNLRELHQGNESINGKIEDLVLNPSRVNKLISQINLPDSILQFQEIRIGSKINGFLDEIILNELNVTVNRTSSLFGRGVIRNISTIDSLKYNFELESLEVEAEMIPYVKDSKLSIDSLGKILFTGRIEGGLNNLTVDGTLNTDIGGLTLDAEISNFRSQISNISYQGKINFREFDIGKFLNRDDLQVLSLNTEINGTGFDFSNGSRLKGIIDSIEYGNYVLKNIEVDAAINDKLVDGRLMINDQKLKMLYDGRLYFDSSLVQSDFSLQIDTFLPKDFGLLNSNAGISGDLSAKIDFPLKAQDKGKIIFKDYVISNENGTYTGDSIVLLAEKVDDSTFIYIKSSFIDAELTGIYSVQSLPIELNDLFNDWTAFEWSDYVHQESENKGFRLKGQVSDSIPIKYFVSKDVDLKSGKFDIRYDFNDQELDGRFTFDSITYGGVKIGSLEINSEGGDESLDVNLDAHKVTINNVISFENLQLDNNFQNGELVSNLLIADKDTLPALDLTADISRSQEYFNISFKNDFIFNDEMWNIQDGANILLYPQKTSINNLIFSTDSNYIAISSLDTLGEDFDITFQNIDLKQLTDFLTGQSSDWSGRLNGNVVLEDVLTNPYFLVNLSLADFQIDKNQLGELRIEASENQGDGTIFTSISLNGPKNKINSTGTYNPLNQELDASLIIGRLEVNLLDPYLTKVIGESQGEIRSEITLSGPINEVKISGDIHLEEVATNIKVNQSRYQINNHSFSFDDQNVEIREMAIFDQKGNQAIVNGNISHNYFKDFEFFLDVKSEGFRFLNTTSEDNPILHGDLIMDANASITGIPELLGVEVIGTPLDSTSLTLSPFSGSQDLLKDDFIRYGTPENDKEISSSYLKQIAQKFPYKADLQLEIDEKTNLKFVVDPITGDFIQGRGNGNLKILINPNGSQEIYGNFLVSEGNYSFNYVDLVNKEFLIKEGSSIRFEGDPLEAVLDIRAIYKSYTSVYELIKNESTLNDDDVKDAKSRTNVEVVLSLTGNLQEPLIKLDIQVPDIESTTLATTIDSKLTELRNNPDELNNQVFGLLLFDSFILSSSASSGFVKVGEDIALKSIGNLISNQLNKFANEVVTGVDIEIDVNSYNSDYINEGAGGNVTELGLKVSKQLINDRLTIIMDGNFNLDKGIDDKQQFSSFVGDFIIEYNLTESGRYRIRAFNKSDYDRLINENEKRNGISLFFNKSFDNKGKKSGND